MEELKKNNIEETLNIITTGCIHGNLDKMYKDIEEYSMKNKKTEAAPATTETALTNKVSKWHKLGKQKMLILMKSKSFLIGHLKIYLK